MDDPGKDDAHPAPAGHGLHQLLIGHQQVDGDVEHGGFGVHQLGSQLLPAGDLDGQTGNAPLPLVVGDGLSLPGGMILPSGPQNRQLVQSIPAHGVDGSGGDDQTRIHPGAHLHTAVRRTAGFGDPLSQGSAGEGNIPGKLRHRAVHPAAAPFRIGDGQIAAVHTHHTPEGHVHQRGLPCLVGIPGSLEPLGIVVGVLPDAEHFAVDPVGVVSVGKALTVEGGHQGIHHAVRDLGLVQSLAVDGGDGGHIFRPLHPAFQLDGSHAHFLQLLQIVDKTVVLQAQRVFFLPVVVAVALTAGLGTAAPVAGAAADHGGHIALAGVAHTQRTVGKDLNLNGRVGADVLNLLPAQLPAEHHPLHAHGGAQLHPGQGVNGHLGGAVNGNVGGDLAAQLGNSQILDNESVHAAQSGVADHFRQVIHFPVGDQSIHRQMYFHTPDVAVFDGIFQSLKGEVLCTLPGIEHSAPQINGVGTILHCGPQGIHGTGRSQQFNHILSPLWYTCKHYITLHRKLPPFP